MNKLKLVLGIILPLVILISLSTLSMSRMGYSIEKEAVDSVEFIDLFRNESYNQDNVVLYKINIKNNFFLPRKFEFNDYLACLNDKERIKRREALSVYYSEGNYARKGPEFIFDELFFGSYREKKSVSIESESEKQVRVLVSPKHIYSRNKLNLFEEYKDYDEILLVKKPTRSYYNRRYLSCYSLSLEDMDDAIRIPIVGQEKVKFVEPNEDLTITNIKL